jgi:hypothetical protein
MCEIEYIYTSCFYLKRRVEYCAERRQCRTYIADKNVNLE